MRRLILIKAMYQFYCGEYKMLLLDELDNGIHQDLFRSIIHDLFNSKYYSDKTIILVSHNKNLQDSDDIFSQKLRISGHYISRL